MLDIAIDKAAKTCHITFTHDIDLANALRTEVPKDGNGKPQGPERNVVADDEVERHIMREAGEEFARASVESMTSELANQQTKDDAHAAELEKLRAEHEGALENKTAEQVAQAAKHQLEMAAKDATIKEQQVYVDACGGSGYAKEQALIAQKEALVREMQDQDAKKAEAEAAKQKAADDLAKLEKP